MNKHDKARKTLDSYSRKYMTLQQDYETLRWTMLTNSSRVKEIWCGVRLFINQIQMAFLLSSKKLHHYLDLMDVKVEPSYAQLHHAAQYCKDVSIKDVILLNYRKIKSYQAWNAAKVRNDFNIVARDFTKLLEQQKNMVQSDNVYEHLLAQHSRGLELDMVKETMNEAFRAYIRFNHKASQNSDKHIEKSRIALPLDLQKRLVQRLLSDMGVNLEVLQFKEGRHPACFGFHENVYMSMRYNEDDTIRTLLTAFHEGGHALYRQNLPDDTKHSAAGSISGRDMDEAMALFWEHAVANNHGFAEYLSMIIREESEGVYDIDSRHIYKQVLQHGSEAIRADADLVNYPLHLMQRHSVAELLLNGHLPIKNLRQVFNEASVSYLGHGPLNDNQGILQDPHWYAGEFTDFDNYFMGQYYALTLYNSMTSHYSEEQLNRDIAQGDFSAIVSWLDQHIYSYGSCLTAGEILKPHSQTDQTIGPYEVFLERKFN